VSNTSLFNKLKMHSARENVTLAKTEYYYDKKINPCTLNKNDCVYQNDSKRN